MPTTFIDLPADTQRIIGNFLDGKSLLTYTDATSDSYDWVFGNRYQAALLGKHWDRAYTAIDSIPDVKERAKVLKHLAQAAPGLVDRVQAFDRIYTAAKRIAPHAGPEAVQLFASLAEMLPSLQGLTRWVPSPSSTPEQSVLDPIDAFDDAVARLQSAEERLWRYSRQWLQINDVSSGILRTLNRLDNDTRLTTFNAVFDAISREDANLARPALSIIAFSIRNLPEPARTKAFDRALDAAERAPTHGPMVQLAKVVPYLPQDAQQDAFNHIHDWAIRKRNKAVMCSLAQALEIWPQEEAWGWFNRLFQAVGDVNYACGNVEAAESFSEALQNLPERFRLQAFMRMLDSIGKISDTTSRSTALGSMARAIPSLPLPDRQEAFESTYIRARTIKSPEDRSCALGALGEVVTDVPNVRLALELIFKAAVKFDKADYRKELLVGMAETVWDAPDPAIRLEMFNRLHDAAMGLDGEPRAQVLGILAKKALPHLQGPEIPGAINDIRASIDGIEPEYKARVLGALGKGMPKFPANVDLQAMCHELNVEAASMGPPRALAKLLVGVSKAVESVQDGAAYSARIPPRQQMPVACSPQARALG
jgi:hypothetical protein